MEDIAKEGNLVLSLDSSWLTHELARMFGSVVFLHNFFAVRTKALRKEIIIESKNRAGWDIYKKANLYYYLKSHEKLELKKLSIPDPGVVEFTSCFQDYASWLISILFVMRDSKKPIDVIVNNWYRVKDGFGRQKRKYKYEHIEATIEMFFNNELIPIIPSHDTKSYKEKIKVMAGIADGIILLHNGNVTDPITTTDHLLTSFATLAYFLKTDKILLDKSYVANGA